MYNPRRGKISIGKETTYGTAPGTLDEFWGLINPLQPTREFDLLEKEGIRDDIEIQGNEIMVERYKFDINIDWLANGKVLYYVFGQQSESGTTDITHTITPLNNSYHPSFTLEVAEKGDSTDDVTTFTGATIDEFTLSWNKGEQIKAKATIIAQGASNGSTIVGTSTEPTGQDYFNWSNLEIDLNGSTFINESGSLTISKNLEAEPRVNNASGDKKISRPTTGSMKYSLTITRKKDDNTISSNWSNGSDNTIVIKLQRSSTDYIQITLSGCKIKTLQPDIDTANSTDMETLTIIPTNATAEVVDQENW